MFIHYSNTRKQIFLGTAAFADSQCRLCIEFVQRAAAGMRPKQFCNAIPGILTKMRCLQYQPLMVLMAVL